MTSDVAYRTTFNQTIAEVAQRRQQAAMAEMATRAQAEAARAAAAAAERETRRAAQRARNTRLVEEAPRLSAMRILKFAARIISFWNDQAIPGYGCVKAYAALTFLSPRHDGFPALMRAVVTVINLGAHPDHARYQDVPEAERTAALTALGTALEAYGVIDHMALIPTGDRNRDLVVRRMEVEEEARRVAEAAARRAAFDQADRERPVVFQRDPEGGIDLRAFAVDPQSVHRSSVQNATQRIVQQLMARPVLDDQVAIFEIMIDLENPDIVSWRNDAYKFTILNMFTDEYFSLEAFSVRYGDVVDRVWSFIRGHAERTELVVRLAQEISEGVGMCANGKMARLVNVLQGYDETLDVEPPREMFQSAIAALMSRPRADREARARELFDEYRIPPEEHDVWLEPLLDGDDAPVGVIVMEA
jgi:hypothetical protein